MIFDFDQWKITRHFFYKFVAPRCVLFYLSSASVMCRHTLKSIYQKNHNYMLFGIWTFFVRFMLLFTIIWKFQSSASIQFCNINRGMTFFELAVIVYMLRNYILIHLPRKCIILRRPSTDPSKRCGNIFMGCNNCVNHNSMF